MPGEGKYARFTELATTLNCKDVNNALSKLQVPTFTGIHVAVVINEMSGIFTDFAPGLSLSVRRLIHSTGSVLNV